MAHLFSIEGNIGSGKSTLVEKLKEDYKKKCKTGDFPQIIFMEEPVSQWVEIKDKDGVNMIEKFYSDQEKYAFSFQMMAYITRLSMLKKCIRENPNAIIICERSLNTDKNIFAKMLYDDNKIEDVKYQIYSNWFDEFISDIPECGIIYVRTEPTKCYERVKIRDRKGETIPLEYLEKCHDYHEKWINYDKNLKTILNGNEHKRDVKDYEMWIDTIYSLIRENNCDGETITQSKCLFTNKSLEELSVTGC
tara:strand:+ start:1052 stop:1798 length:747 start_codon:yes stop_codon:yes gene_type:complete